MIGETMPLTDAEIKQFKSPKDDGKHFDGGGLYLERTAAGAMYWRLKYHFAGKENRISLGVYPETKLKAAREARETARALLKSAQTPASNGALNGPVVPKLPLIRSRQWRVSGTRRKRLAGHLFTLTR